MKNNLYLINNFKKNIDINTINDWKIAKGMLVRINENKLLF